MDLIGVDLMPPILLAVKFYIPKARAGLVERLQLLDRFTAGCRCPLTLISAPTGFGKSTLLSAWLDRQAAERSPAAQANVDCWLSLDAADNYPPRYWTYFVAAIQTGFARRQTETGTGPKLNLDQLLEYLQSDPPPAISTVLDELINALSGSAERMLLVLDDYHVIQTPEIQEQMTYLLEHQPPNLHLVIATRADPALPITRLRARGQLSEFRAADLRFSIPETEHFFKTTTGVMMGAEEISAVQTSTEGWIAGLQMAALALQALLNEEAAQGAAAQSAGAQSAGAQSVGAQSVGEQAAARQGKIKEFVASFSGKHLYILDYLTDEVFNRQPAEIRAFLLQTAVLKRMSAGLCAAVLGNEAENGRADPAAASVSLAKANAILNNLEKSNLFLIPLDHERQWFRYHHLFADLLLARLEQAYPDLVPGLHGKASHWYAQNGFVDDAVQHALQARDWNWAAQLMEMNVTPYLELGQLNTVLKWIELAP